jgi:hypothetical protein
MSVNSWLHLRQENPHNALPSVLRARDPMAARDCGWVEQMTPFIQSHAKRDAWVIDPFCGFASTLVAALGCGVRAAGVELEPGRVKLAQERLALLGANAENYPVFNGSVTDQSIQNQLGSSIESKRQFFLCLTNIPYFGCAEQALSRASDPLYMAHDYNTYLQNLRHVFNAVHQLLEPDSWCVVMAQNLNLGGTFIPLAWDVAKLLSERFVMHDERVLIYERSAAQVLPHDTTTNRAHEYALVCKKQSRAISPELAHQLLAELKQAGFRFEVYGSFAKWLQGERHVVPSDLDLLVPANDAQVSRLMQWLEANGFGIESWNAAFTPPVSVAALAYRHYFRARRIQRNGQSVQIDVAIAR